MGTVMHKSRVLRPVLTGWAIATVVGLLLGITGPFGSYLNGTPMVRIAYWVVCLWSGWLAFGVSVPIMSRWAARRGVRAWLWMPPAIAVLTLLPAVLSRAAAVRLWPVVQSVRWVEWYGQGLVISAVLTLAMTWLTRSRAEVTIEGPETEFVDPRDRLPARLGRDVQCLQMEDHYVRVHTSQGSALVLMSLSQAMAGLKDIDGIQTHRSWWVARSAMVGTLENGRNLRLKLAGGIEAPVSRSRLGVLRQEGWLAPFDAN